MIRVLLTQITERKILELMIFAKIQYKVLGMFGSMARIEEREDSDVDLLVI
jgi:predicted nucleotidyltransferase